MFVLNINANEFNLKRLEELLIDPMIDYSLSRSVREKYKNKSGTLTKKAKEKFQSDSLINRISYYLGNAYMKAKDYKNAVKIYENIFI